MPPLRTAILGCGGFAHRHARLLAELKDEIALVAFCDRNEPKARAFSEQYTAGRAPAFTHHHLLLDRADLQLLVICLPPYGHADEVERAAERGVHLLVEKPIALTAEHAWRMVEAAEKAQVKTQVGFMFRFGEPTPITPRFISPTRPTARRRLSPRTKMFTGGNCGICWTRSARAARPAPRCGRGPNHSTSRWQPPARRSAGCLSPC